MEFSIKISGIIVILAIHCSHASWTSPNSKQYHIQTDEGPERYFRYLTDNGQFRKEKRLQDGTVIGTDAWIDASGFLRQKEYIADGEGYRILKSKTVYVGKDQPIEDAMRSLKSSLSSHSSDNAITKYQPASAAPEATSSNYIPTTTASWLYYDHPSPQLVYTSSKSQPINNLQDLFTLQPKSNPIGRNSLSPGNNEKQNVPSLKLQPPFGELESTVQTSPIRRNQYESVNSIYSTPAPRTHISVEEAYPTQLSTLNTELLPPISSATRADNGLDFADHISTTPTPIIFSRNKDVLPVASNDLDQQPLYSRSNIGRRFPDHKPYSHKLFDYNRNFGSGYERQFPEYDGIAVSNNGFRYYLPRQYHEEEGSDTQHRVGSFGYIDPFGIRRVTYYNASPEGGFVHKKNNRYVGFNATPYDPRPI